MSKYFKHQTACIDEPVSIGIGTKIWHFSHVMSGAKIGENCILGQNTFVGGKAKIGNRVKIQNNVSIYDSVVLEDDVFCGPSCVFTNVNTPRSFIERKDEFQKTLVKKGTTIGANATIVCGVTIGEYAFIGAGAVIIENVKPFALMVGVPAKQKGWVSKSGAVLDESLVCPETGEKYQFKNDQLEIIEA
ncbi:acyltransferase [Sunxiuqinia sp. A32]|uniref:acyltransferase n=1 Tax=Sunxiuqinia sp. A32 TaxID=3461496 RepID=UPI004046237E